MNGRRKPKFVTLREYPQAGPLVVRLLEDERTRTKVVDVREYRFPEGLLRNGFRIRKRTDVALLVTVLEAVLRDPLF